MSSGSADLRPNPLLVNHINRVERSAEFLAQYTPVHAIPRKNSWVITDLCHCGIVTTDVIFRTSLNQELELQWILPLEVATTQIVGYLETVLDRYLLYLVCAEN